MRFERFIEEVGDRPLIDTIELAREQQNPSHFRSQLSRWVADGRLMQLRRGLYALAPPYDRVTPHPLHIAATLQDSYVSGESALHFHSVIPEPIDLLLPEGLGPWIDETPSRPESEHRRTAHSNPWHNSPPPPLKVIRCATSGRPRERHTPFGDYDYRHLGPQIYAGFETHEVAQGQTADIATPEKALLDLIYLQPGGVNARYLSNLPSIDWSRIDIQVLSDTAAQSGVRRLSRAVRLINRMLCPTRISRLAER